MNHVSVWLSHPRPSLTYFTLLYFSSSTLRISDLSSWVPGRAYKRWLGKCRGTDYTRMRWTGKAMRSKRRSWWKERFVGKGSIARAHALCSPWALWQLISIEPEHIELPAKLLDYFLWSNKSNINQVTVVTCWLRLRGLNIILSGTLCYWSSLSLAPQNSADWHAAHPQGLHVRPESCCRSGLSCLATMICCNASSAWTVCTAFAIFRLTPGWRSYPRIRAAVRVRCGHQVHYELGLYLPALDCEGLFPSLSSSLFLFVSLPQTTTLTHPRRSSLIFLLVFQ